MSTHPNVILLVSLNPDGLTRKTLREILADAKVATDEQDAEIKISGQDYSYAVMESDYLEDWQISGYEGDIVFFRLITYGYGEKVKWADLEKEKSDLEQWAKSICEKFHCRYDIFVTANYW